MSLSFTDIIKQGQLSFLMKHQHNSMELIDFIPGTERPCLGYFTEDYRPNRENNVHDVCETQKGETAKVTL